MTSHIKSSGDWSVCGQCGCRHRKLRQHLAVATALAPNSNISSLLPYTKICCGRWGSPSLRYSCTPSLRYSCTPSRWYGCTLSLRCGCTLSLQYRCTLSLRYGCTPSLRYDCTLSLRYRTWISAICRDVVFRANVYCTCVCTAKRTFWCLWFNQTAMPVRVAAASKDSTRGLQFCFIWYLLLY